MGSSAHLQQPPTIGFGEKTAVPLSLREWAARPGGAVHDSSSHMCVWSVRTRRLGRKISGVGDEAGGRGARGWLGGPRGLAEVHIKGNIAEAPGWK